MNKESIFDVDLTLDFIQFLTRNKVFSKYMKAFNKEKGFSEGNFSYSTLTNFFIIEEPDRWIIRAFTWREHGGQTLWDELDYKWNEYCKIH